jgi:hypothetical protein
VLFAAPIEQVAFVGNVARAREACPGDRASGSSSMTFQISLVPQVVKIPPATRNGGRP